MATEIVRDEDQDVDSDNEDNDDHDHEDGDDNAGSGTSWLVTTTCRDQSDNYHYRQEDYRRVSNTGNDELPWTDVNNPPLWAEHCLSDEELAGAGLKGGGCRVKTTRKGRLKVCRPQPRPKESPLLLWGFLRMHTKLLGTDSTIWIPKWFRFGNSCTEIMNAIPKRLGMVDPGIR